MIAAPMKRCVLCGRSRELNKHHLGGQNHIPWLTMLLCESCHDNFHAKFRQSVNFHFTPNKKMRLIRAMQAILVFLWMLLEMLRSEIQSLE
jgi:uncharacterized protein YlaI